MEDSTQKNYYEVLEIAVDASPEEIHQGYQRARNAYSQDSLALYSLMSADECNNILELIDEAYTILCDPNKRKQYDLARGLNQNLSTQERQGQGHRKEEGESFNDSHFINQSPSSTSKTNMSKIVAKKKFSLDYTRDIAFEEEIEKAEEFSGEYLKKIREYKNVDIVRMAEMTKISKTYLLNIEADDFDKLPAPVYVRGFVYQVAKCLKLNPELVATSYLYRLKKAKNLL